MKAVGLIVEYNPFHNGHLYHLEETKKLYPDHVIIVVMSAHFTQRGHPAIINKWERTKISLDYGIDIVCELPFVFTCEHANLFAKGAVRILNNLKVERIVFGSETNDVNNLIDLAKIQLYNENYEPTVKKLMDEGLNYATACSDALKEITGYEVNVPNDILGLAYIKEILQSGFNIEPITIKRTNDYHSVELDNYIASATAVRQALSKDKDVKNFVPEKTYESLLNSELHFMNDYFELLKYKIITSSIEELREIHGVDEGLEYRIKKAIGSSRNIDEFIKNIKTKRYTYNRINRMLVHILMNYTKSMRKNITDIEYSRLLGFSELGRKYISKIKKSVEYPIISKFSDLKSIQLDMEMKVSKVYNLTCSENLDVLEFTQHVIRR